MTKQEYLLVKLGEECAELQQVISKILIFGEGTHFANNVEELQKEFNDILGVAEMLYDDGVEINSDFDLINAKKEKVEYYMKESRRIGTLDDE